MLIDPDMSSRVNIEVDIEWSCRLHGIGAVIRERVRVEFISLIRRLLNAGQPWKLQGG